MPDYKYQVGEEVLFPSGGYDMAAGPVSARVRVNKMPKYRLEGRWYFEDELEATD